MTGLCTHTIPTFSFNNSPPVVLTVLTRTVFDTCRNATYAVIRLMPVLPLAALPILLPPIAVTLATCCCHACLTCHLLLSRLPHCHLLLPPATCCCHLPLVVITLASPATCCCHLPLVAATCHLLLSSPATCCPPTTASDAAALPGARCVAEGPRPVCVGAGSPGTAGRRALGGRGRWRGDQGVCGSGAWAGCGCVWLRGGGGGGCGSGMAGCGWRWAGGWALNGVVWSGIGRAVDLAGDLVAPLAAGCGCCCWLCVCLATVAVCAWPGRWPVFESLPLSQTQPLCQPRCHIAGHCC
jgi:hypothetical protein